MTLLESLIPQLAVFAGRVPDPFLESALLLSLQGLCNDALCWRFTHPPIPVAAGENPIDLYELPGDSAVVQVMWAEFGGFRLRRGSTDQWARQSATWSDDQGMPVSIQSGDAPNTVLLGPTPQSSGELRLGVALQPSYSATSIDDTVLNRYGDALIDGACYRVFQIPGKSWSDARMAMFYLSRYEAAKRLIASQATDGFQQGVVRQVRYGGY